MYREMILKVMTCTIACAPARTGTKALRIIANVTSTSPQKIGVEHQISEQ